MLKTKYNFIIFILTCLISIPILFNPNYKPTQIVNAQYYQSNLISQNSKTGYYRIITSDTPFYSDANGENLLFYLPYTYYVKVISFNEQSLSHVECYGLDNTPLLDGYVPTEKLFFDNLAVQSPYLNLQITTANACILYIGKNLDNVYQYIFAERNCKYYGHLTLSNGEYIFYVSYNNKLGYVKESDVIPFSIENHPNPLTFLETEPTIPDAEIETDAENITSLRIAIIVCLLFAGLIAIIYIIRTKPKKEVAVSYYDDNDFE